MCDFSRAFQNLAVSVQIFLNLRCWKVIPPRPRGFIHHSPTTWFCGRFCLSGLNISCFVKSPNLTNNSSILPFWSALLPVWKQGNEMKNSPRDFDKYHLLCREKIRSNITSLFTYQLFKCLVKWKLTLTRLFSLTVGRPKCVACLQYWCI